jgi:hypothetical protein
VNVTNVNNTANEEDNTAVATPPAANSTGNHTNRAKMTIQQRVAIVATVVLGLVMMLQLLLAAGLPLGQAAWGGQDQVLPPNLRWASLATVAILALAAWVVLARANIAAPGAEPVVIQVITWVFAGFLALNALGNIASSSAAERYVMTPVALLLVVCFIVVALSRQPTRSAADAQG